MTGENPELSMRAKRRLPQSFLGRAFFTWFNPGPGTGFVFASGSLLAAAAAAGILLLIGMRYGGGRGGTLRSLPQILALAVLLPGYIICYLGAGLLLIRFLGRFVRGSIILAALLQILLLTFGVAGPLVLESMFSANGIRDYSLLQITNPFWSIIHVIERSNIPPEGPFLLIAVPVGAAVIFLLNLPGILHEVRHVRAAMPHRVAEEDQQIAAKTVPQGPVQVSPWDVE